VAAKTYGKEIAKVYDDYDHVHEVVTLPENAPHRNVDIIVLGAAKQHPGKVHPAIVCPPTIYGPGRGAGNQKSIQAVRLAKAVLQHGKGLQVGEGTNVWTQIHVQDLSNVYLRLVEEAIKGGGSATWGEEAYYFAEDGEFYWGDVAKRIAKEAFKKGYIPTSEMDIFTPAEADELCRYGSFLWAFNSRCRAVRARKLLGWKPELTKKIPLLETLGDTVEEEARELGIVLGHAAKAAGEESAA
jgi:nucleoside-diphosphate-sugar epimerase